MKRRRDRIVLVEDKRRAAADRPQGGGLEKVVTIAAAAVGLVGYLYALGGIVVWLRIQTSQVSSNGALISANDKHLLEVGGRVVAFELLLMLAVGALVSVLFAVAVLRRGRLRSPRRLTLEEARESKEALAPIVGLEASLLLISVGFSIDRFEVRTALCVGGGVLGLLVIGAMIAGVRGADGEQYRGWFRGILNRLEARKIRTLQWASVSLFVLAVGIGLGLIPLLQGTILLTGTAMIYVGHVLRWPQRNTPGAFLAELVRSTGVWLAVVLATAVALAWVATPPVTFTYAVVSSADGSDQTPGAYLDRGDGGIYLGFCEQSRQTGADHPVSIEPSVQLFGAAESAHLELRRVPYTFDPGGRPSLAQVAIAILGAGSTATDDAPLPHSLRGRAATLCGAE